MQPKQFKVRPDGFSEIKRKFLFRLASVLIVGFTVGTLINQVNTSPEEDSNEFLLPFMITFFVLVFGISIYRGLNKGKALFESFTLTIEPNSIYRDQLNTPVIHIYHSEVKQISRLKNGSLLIKSGEAANLIAIPAQIEGKEELEAMLNRIKPIDDSPKLTFAQRYPLILSFLSLALMGLVFVSTNKWMVSIGGSILAAFLLWCLYEGRRSKNIDQRTKKGLWWILVVIFAVAARMLLILLGYQ